MDLSRNLQQMTILRNKNLVKPMNMLEQNGINERQTMQRFLHRLFNVLKFGLGLVVIPQATIIVLLALIYSAMETPEDLAFWNESWHGAYIYYSRLAGLTYIITFLAGKPLLRHFYKEKKLSRLKAYLWLATIYFLLFIVGILLTPFF